MTKRDTSNITNFDIEKIKALIKYGILCKRCPFNNIYLMKVNDINICQSKCHKVFPDLDYHKSDHLACPCATTKNQNYIIRTVKRLLKEHEQSSL